MNTITRFSAKSELYAARRWDYDPAAVAELVQLTSLQPGDPVADVGAGAGALTRHLLAHGLRVTAVEPSLAMQAIATANLGCHPGFTAVDGLADATGLPDDSVALIAVGRAMHWFPFASTRREFLRIVRPPGWLALLAVDCTDKELSAAVAALQSEQLGWDVAASKGNRPPVDLPALYGGVHYRRLEFPSIRHENRGQFVDRLLSISSAPSREHPRFSLFVQAAQALFDSRAVDGVMAVPVATVVTVGRMVADA